MYEPDLDSVLFAGPPEYDDPGDSCDQYDDYWYDSAIDDAIASEEADNA